LGMSMWPDYSSPMIWSFSPLPKMTSNAHSIGLQPSAKVPECVSARVKLK